MMQRREFLGAVTSLAVVPLLPPLPDYGPFEDFEGGLPILAGFEGPEIRAGTLKIYFWRFFRWAEQVPGSVKADVVYRIDDGPKLFAQVPVYEGDGFIELDLYDLSPIHFVLRQNTAQSRRYANPTQ